MSSSKTKKRKRKKKRELASVGSLVDESTRFPWPQLFGFLTPDSQGDMYPSK
jgi:hypothetical protein